MGVYDVEVGAWTELGRIVEYLAGLGGIGVQHPANDPLCLPRISNYRVVVDDDIAGPNLLGVRDFRADFLAFVKLQTDLYPLLLQLARQAVQHHVAAALFSVRSGRDNESHASTARKVGLRI